MSTRPALLQGIRVVDLSDRLSGAFCARLLADFGAAVTLAEPPAGHPLRAEPPFLDGVPGPDRSLLHLYANDGKHSQTLAPDDHAGLRALLNGADIVVTTSPLPPAPEIASDNPHLLHVSVTPYGLTGPLAGRPGTDLTADARAGWSSLGGDPGMPPLASSAHQTGYLAGLLAFVATLAALRERESRGPGAGGQLIDVSELEARTVITGPAILVSAYSGITRDRHEPDLLRGPVACKDGHFSLTISRAQFWRDAMNVLGLHDLAEDPRYAASHFRQAQREHYSARVEACIREWNRWELFDALATVRCVAGVVQETSDVVQSPHLAARGFFEQRTLPDGRAVAFPGAPFKMRIGQPAGPAVPGGSRGPRPHPHTGPLSGTRAILLTQAWSGTFSTELLGFLGADIVQIEARRRPDSWRGDYRAPVGAGVRDDRRRQRPWNVNGLFNSVNMNKRGMTLDLSHPRGMEIYRSLIPFTDIVAENFTPRVMGNLGLAFDDLRTIKPDIILASLSAYGATGPYANVPGIGGTIEPMSGMSGLLGYEGGRPQNSGQMYPDPVSGAYFAAAMIMALRERDRTGAPVYIDLGMMEACATFIGDALLEYAANGTVRPRMGNHHQRIAPHNIYPARDGRWLALAADSEDAWRALCRATGLPVAEHPRFATMAARKANEAALDALIEGWTREQDADEAAATLLAVGVSAAPVNSVRSVVQDTHLNARGLFVAPEHPEAGAFPVPGVPWQLSRTPAAVTRPAPMMGQHSREVLAELLGIGDEEYEDLVSLGITGDMPPD